MSQPDRRALHLAIADRYGALACCSTSLSCGSALDLAEPAPGETLLDLGCGRGQDVLRAAGRVGSQGRAIGLDATEAMLQEARRAVPPFLSNVSFVAGDLAATGMAAGSVDVVISNCTVNHAPDKAAVYREILRVLRPGGRFVVSDVVAEAELPAHVREDPAAWAACYGGALTETQNRSAMAAGGFPEVEVLQRSEPYDKGGVRVRSLTFRGRRPAPDPTPAR